MMFLCYDKVIQYSVAANFRQESQSPVLEGINFPTFQERDQEAPTKCEGKALETETNEKVPSKVPLTQSSSIGQKAKDVLTRQSSNASEKISGNSRIYCVLLLLPVLCCNIIHFTTLHLKEVLCDSILLHSVS